MSDVDEDEAEVWRAMSPFTFTISDFISLTSLIVIFSHYSHSLDALLGMYFARESNCDLVR